MWQSSILNCQPYENVCTMYMFCKSGAKFKKSWKYFTALLYCLAVLLYFLHLFWEKFEVLKYKMWRRWNMNMQEEYLNIGGKNVGWILAGKPEQRYSRTPRCSRSPEMREAFSSSPTPSPVNTRPRDNFPNTVSRSWIVYQGSGFFFLLHILHYYEFEGRTPYTFYLFPVYF